MKKEILYIIFRPIFTFIFKMYYNPTIINKEYIPIQNDYSKYI